MPEPSLSTAAIMTGAAAAVPTLVVFGVSLGLRPDVLLAGFSGSVAAMGLLNSVPSTGDSARELLRTTFKRVGVAVASAVTAGYASPIVALMAAIPDALLLGISFVVGAGAQQILPKLILRLGDPQPRPKADGG